MIQFRVLSVMTAVLAFTLFLSFFLVPEPLFFLFGIEGNESAFFIARRMGLLFLGFSILAWYGKDAEHSRMRQTVCLSFAVAILGLAGLGVVEFFRGTAGIGILLPIVIELFLGTAYLNIWFVRYKAKANVLTH